MTSILSSIKEPIGISIEETDFDAVLIMHTNTVFMGLCSMGIGPTNGFSITGINETWETYLGSSINMEGVKTYVALKVGSIFDPSISSFAQDALERRLKEFEWRLMAQQELNGLPSNPPVIP